MYLHFTYSMLGILKLVKSVLEIFKSHSIMIWWETKKVSVKHLWLWLRFPGLFCGPNQSTMYWFSLISFPFYQLSCPHHLHLQWLFCVHILHIVHITYCAYCLLCIYCILCNVHIAYCILHIAYCAYCILRWKCNPGVVQIGENWKECQWFKGVQCSLFTEHCSL